MRISDWSSDVCSSDLSATARQRALARSASGRMARLTSRQVTSGSNSGRYLGKLGRAILFRSNLSLCAEGYTWTPMCMAPTGNGETALHEPLRAKIGRAHVCTPVTNAHLVFRLLL